MSAYDSIFAALQGDAQLSAILTGGIYDGAEVSDISRQATPAAYDEYSELNPAPSSSRKARRQPARTRTGRGCS